MSRPGRHLAYLGAAGIAAAFVAHSLYLAVVAEDAFITFRYSLHLAGGHGLAAYRGAARR